MINKFVDLMRVHAEGVKEVKKMERKVKETSEREKVKKYIKPAQTVL